MTMSFHSHSLSHFLFGSRVEQSFPIPAYVMYRMRPSLNFTSKMTMFIEIFIFNLDDLFSCARSPVGQSSISFYQGMGFSHHIFSCKVWVYSILFRPHFADYIGYVVVFHPGKWPWIFLVALEKLFFTLFYFR